MATPYQRVGDSVEDMPNQYIQMVILHETRIRTYIHEISSSDSRYVSYTEFDHSQEHEKLTCSTEVGTQDQDLDHDHGSKDHKKSFSSIQGISRLTQYSDESQLSTFRIAVAANLVVDTFQGSYHTFRGSVLTVLDSNGLALTLTCPSGKVLQEARQKFRGVQILESIT